MPGSQVRETMIVPVTVRGGREARGWLDMYGTEDSWLDLALDLAELPDSDEILSWPSVPRRGVIKAASISETDLARAEVAASLRPGPAAISTRISPVPR